MATKIDLLPRYVPMRRRLRKWTYAMVTLCLAVLAFIVAVNVRQTERLRVTTENAATVTARATITNTTETDTGAIVAKTAASADAVKFFMDAAKTGGQRAQLIDEVRRYFLSSPRLGTIKVDIMDISTANATMTLGVPNREAYVNGINVLRQAELDDVFVKGSTKLSGLKTFNDRPVPEVYLTGLNANVSPGEIAGTPEGVNVATTLVHPSTEPVPPGAAALATTTGGTSSPSPSASSPSSPSPSTGGSPGANPTGGPAPSSAAPGGNPTGSPRR